MSRQRLLLWLSLLVIVLGVRWWDPLGRPPIIEAASAPVERASHAVSTPAPVASNEAASSASGAGHAWPVRLASSQDKPIGNAFLARGDVPVPAPVVKQPVVALFYGPPVPYVPPPPPPPVEVPPALQVVGTWGEGATMGVFLAGPQGTVLARQGDVLLSQYRVQSITKQQLSLLQNSNQRVWNLPIPVAPSTLQTWPGR
ncbi:MAG: hypothetical protein Q7U28_13105 [Aquabacterium sp.]|nr:hypothetical protein [Aquabacterium sp.]